jgi:HAMP domain-containing protein
VTENLPYIALGVGALALIVAIWMAVRFFLLHRSLVILQGKGNAGEFITAVNRHVAEVNELRAEIGRLRTELQDVRTDLHDAIRHVAVVRYDAFDDLAGRMSFSAAMLDDQGDGLVISSLNARSESRAYAKGIKEGKAFNGTLSPEEEEAVRKARGQ